jgi:hypothetical protein
MLASLATPHKGACQGFGRPGAADMQRILIAVGVLLVLVGLAWPWLGKLGLGRLPGDIRIETANGFFYFPITTCVVISIVISVVVWFLRR